LSRPLRLRGISASLGVAVGEAALVSRGHRLAPRRHIDASEADAECRRFEHAVEASSAELRRSKEELSSRHGEAHAPILDIYILMHLDVLLRDAVFELIRQEGLNAEWALAKAVKKLKQPLLTDDSSYFRERARDMDHVEEHLLRHLQGEPRQSLVGDEPRILLARDLSPVDAVHMLAPPTLGLVTEIGGPSSHTAILARAFGLPCVCSVGRLPEDVEDGETLVVDGFAAEVIVGPSPAEAQAARARRRRFISFLQAEQGSTSNTADGVEVSLMANLGLPSELEHARRENAQGIGLYRTEFIALDQQATPDEAEQLSLYRTAVLTMAPWPVVFRTFDWRGGKQLGDYRRQVERATLRTQLRATLQASAEGAAAVMIPMVATVAELRAARGLVEACRAELEQEGRAYGELPVGMMVELPAAAILAETFAKEADFFAVGTNDLVQYSLGVDRTEGGVLEEAQALHPAVLRLLDQVVRAAADAQIPCSLCGDMASDSYGIVLALGLGFRQLSVPVSLLPLARAIIRRVDTSLAATIAREALDLDSAAAVRQRVVRSFGRELSSLWADHDG
jgi:phosphotransferase system enzyme I (PtsI)